VNRLAVVVPAHDEAELLPRCLAGLAVAVERVAPVPVNVIVVADACTDATAAVAAAGGAIVVTGTAGRVGAARAAGMARALRRGPDGLWLATTDADSLVPPDWLAWHLAHARAGAGVLAGTVEVDDWTPWPYALQSRYDTRYRAGVDGTTHAHVHGANLGVSGTVYVAAGGFPPVTHDEDRALIARARATGARIVSDTRCPVITSSRAGGAARAPHGFAGHLVALAADLLRPA
jgi:glycosyltransferase involved in cell wall biosynthesis